MTCVRERTCGANVPATHREELRGGDGVRAVQLVDRRVDPPRRPFRLTGRALRYLTGGDIASTTPHSRTLRASGRWTVSYQRFHSASMAESTSAVTISNTPGTDIRRSPQEGGGGWPRNIQERKGCAFAGFRTTASWRRGRRNVRGGHRARDAPPPIHRPAEPSRDIGRAGSRSAKRHACHFISKPMDAAREDQR